MNLYFHGTDRHGAGADAAAARDGLQSVLRRYVALFLPPLDPLRGETAQGRQGRLLGSLLAATLLLAVSGLAAALLSSATWAAVLGPLCFALCGCARLSRTGRVQIASRLFITALTLAALGMEATPISVGPASLFVALGAVFACGFLLGRWAPFVCAALTAPPMAVHLYIQIASHVVRVGPTNAMAPPWLAVVPIVLLSGVALASSLLTGSLEEARARADELARINAALADANARLESLTTTDPLTGLLNHRGMVLALDAEMERAHRYGLPFALLFLDIDHFKALNDGYGHAAGDAILQEFARLVRGELRGVDVLGRWGGEEFVILLPQMGAAGAAAAAERVRAAVARHVFPLSGGLRLTVSIGTAAFLEDAGERGPLLDAADRAMYAAKRLGRNQVRRADDPAVAVLRMDIVEHGSREDSALLGTVEALACLVAARDGYTGEHSQAVAALAVRLVSALGLSDAEARMVGLAGRLHDIGKVGISDAILHKPGRLSEDEWAVIRRHPLTGANVVGHVPALRALAPLIRGHHERWDGGGYPDALSGEAIPLGARVLAVAGAYQAMTSDRPYHAARDHAWAMAQIARLAGTQFDPRVADALMTVLGEV